jgi:hypothetical protein
MLVVPSAVFPPVTYWNLAMRVFRVVVSNTPPALK